MFRNTASATHIRRNDDQESGIKRRKKGVFACRRAHEKPNFHAVQVASNWRFKGTLYLEYGSRLQQHILRPGFGSITDGQRRLEALANAGLSLFLQMHSIHFPLSQGSQAPPCRASCWKPYRSRYD